MALALIDQVRLTIGDKTVPYNFTDAEIQHFLDTYSDDVNLASAAALEAWAAQYMTSPTAEKIGDYSYAKKTVDNMLALAAKLKTATAMTPAQDWATMDLLDDVLEADE